MTVLLALTGVGLGAHFQVIHSTETLAGLQAPTDFLPQWQQVGSLAGTSPAGVVRLWSGTATAPTRLPVLSSTTRINTLTAGDQALVWVFNETVGIALSTEIELRFVLQYHFGTATTSVTATAYIETQRRALGAPLSFTVYWDSGQATGVTWVNQLEVSLVCPAVGTCP